MELVESRLVEYIRDGIERANVDGVGEPHTQRIS